MKMILLTEYIGTESDGIKERPVLINLEGIGTVAPGKIAPEGIPLVGVNSADVPCVVITLRNNQRITVKESFNTVQEIILHLCENPVPGPIYRNEP